jgi:flagellar hook assembly protein FlgD
VRTLLQAQQMDGVHSVVWDGRNEMGMSVATGTYFAELTWGDRVARDKMQLLK